jgi:hypothetical protein
MHGVLRTNNRCILLLLITTKRYFFEKYFLRFEKVLFYYTQLLYVIQV